MNAPRPLRVSYAPFAPPVDSLRADEAIVDREVLGRISNLFLLEQRIAAGAINRLALVGRGALTGWRLYVRREVLFEPSCYVPALSREDQRQLVERFRPMLDATR